MTDRPNILLIFPDQWRGDCLGALGHPVVETPHLDQLAAQGVTFTSAFTQCPSCIAARASLVTGLSPAATGRMGYRDGVPWRYPDTMMRVLRDSGYQTLMSGKTHFFPQRAALGFEEMRLYDVLRIHPDFQSDYHAWLERETAGRVEDTAIAFSSNSWFADPWVHEERLHPNTWTADQAIELMKRRDPTRPFFMQVGFHRPHPPIDPPLAWFERFADRPIPDPPMGDWAAAHDRPIANVDGPAQGRLPRHVLERTRRAYYAQIGHLDRQIGRILWWMTRNRLNDNTWVVFASDHGEMLGDHCIWRKVVPFQGSADIPFIVRPPKGHDAPRGVRRTEPVTLMDIMPSALEWAGVESPRPLEGLSLDPLVRGESCDWREFVHGEHASGEGWQFVTDGKEKFAWASVTGDEWFFDLANDPNEEANRVDDLAYAERVDLWRRRLVEVLAQRPEHDLTDGEALKPGKCAPKVRPELLEDP